MNNNPALNKSPVSQFAQLFNQLPAVSPAQKKKLLVWSDCAVIW